MRAAMAFDTHAYVKKLIAAGVPERQAEVQAEALSEIALANLATKDDLSGLEQRIDSRFAQIELRLTMRMGAMLAGAVALIVALQKLL